MNKIQKIAGVLSSQEIIELIQKNVITSENGIEKDLIQPASIDLRLGIKAWRVPASFLPGKGNKVSTSIFQIQNIIRKQDIKILLYGVLYVSVC